MTTTDATTAPNIEQIFEVLHEQSIAKRATMHNIADALLPILKICEANTVRKNIKREGDANKAFLSSTYNQYDHYGDLVNRTDTFMFMSTTKNKPSKNDGENENFFNTTLQIGKTIIAENMRENYPLNSKSDFHIFCRDLAHAVYMLNLNDEAQIQIKSMLVDLTKIDIPDFAQAPLANNPPPIILGRPRLMPRMPDDKSVLPNNG